MSLSTSDDHLQDIIDTVRKTPNIWLRMYNNIIKNMREEDVFQFYTSLKHTLPPYAIQAILAQAPYWTRLEIFGLINNPTEEQLTIVKKYSHLPEKFITEYSYRKAAYFLNNIPGKILSTTVQLSWHCTTLRISSETYNFMINNEHHYISRNELLGLFKNTREWRYSCFNYRPPNVVDPFEDLLWKHPDPILFPPFVNLRGMYVLVSQIYKILESETNIDYIIKEPLVQIISVIALKDLIKPGNLSIRCENGITVATIFQVARPSKEACQKRPKYK